MGEGRGDGPSTPILAKHRTKSVEPKRASSGDFKGYDKPLPVTVIDSFCSCSHRNIASSVRRRADEFIQSHSGERPGGLSKTLRRLSRRERKRRWPGGGLALSQAASIQLRPVQNQIHARRLFADR